MKIGVGVGVCGRDTQDTQRSSITEINFSFQKSTCVLNLSVNNQPIEKLEIQYKTSKFQNTLENTLKEKGLSVLDITSVSNLYYIKLMDHLLFRILKKGMLSISSFSARAIHSANPEGKIQDLVKEANTQATNILAVFEENFEKMAGIVNESHMQVFDRSGLIKKAKDELKDNLLRKHLLIVNQLIELQRNVDPPSTNLSQQIENFIRNL